MGVRLKGARDFMNPPFSFGLAKRKCAVHGGKEKRFGRPIGP
jgi:hypothetical protein